MSNFPPPPPPPPPGIDGPVGRPALTPAPLIRRFAASALEVFFWVICLGGLVASLFNGILALPNDSGEPTGDPVGNVLLLIVLAIGCCIGLFVWTINLWRHGTTPGKKLLGLRVVDAATSGTAGFGQMMLREGVIKGFLGSVLWGVPFAIGCVVILVNPRRAAPWDMVLRTTVVDVR